MPVATGWIIILEWIILFGESVPIIATILLALANSPDKYLSYVLRAFFLVPGGAVLTYNHANIAILRTSPASVADTVGVNFNCALQLRSAVGIAAVGAITASVEKAHRDRTSYQGRAAAFWFLLGIDGAEVLAMLVFYRIDKEDLVTNEELAKKAVDLEHVPADVDL
ncbi:hypothetical protein CERSUDRAFT_96087 [Gelatoporia subvermispora B]|uniref:Major facilitator superfamily (MFS) profile domain-containing protein n=1 Tax=Ceriporiopsis subvermispora (strain B) TaxID=914234 RepID=M2QFP3_CERS8|nr:hypothetical protein CERSUDRAFT_96087 [Gelatoporia subvermispora B]